MRHSQTGLTLTEMLISIAILAMVMTAITPLLKSANESARRIEATAKTSEAYRSNYAILSTLFSNIIHFEKLEGLEQKIKGSSREFTFTSLGANTLPAEVKLSVNTDKNALTVSIKESETEYQFSMFENFEKLQLSYYGTTSLREEDKWQQTWESRKPPKLLRFSASSQENIMSFDFSLGGQSPLVCEHDPVSRICRNGV